LKYLVIGGLGFLGSNLAREAIRRKEDLFIMDNFYRVGCSENLSWLKKYGPFKLIRKDIRNSKEVETTIKNVKPDVVFHVAGQVAMTTSLKDPRLDFEINAQGTFNILEAIRKFSPNSSYFYASTNKVYGDLENIEYIETDTRYIPKDFPNGFNESLPLHFQSPYGCSKGTADQYSLDYGKMFKIKSVVFRHSTIYGSRQFATFDQGWIGWFCQKALETKTGNIKEKFKIHGNGKQVRDLLYIDDVVDLYFNAVKNIEKIKGKAFNIGGGIDKSLSILELFNFLEQELKIRLEYQKAESRPSDQKFFVADITKAKNLINWKPKISIQEGIRSVIEWIS